MPDQRQSVDSSRDPNHFCLVGEYVCGARAPAIPHPLLRHAVRDARVHDDDVHDGNRGRGPLGHERGGGHDRVCDRALDVLSLAVRRRDRGPAQSQVVDRAGAGHGRATAGGDRAAAGGRAADAADLLHPLAVPRLDVRVHEPGAAGVHGRHRGAAAGRERDRAIADVAHLGAAVLAVHRFDSGQDSTGAGRHLHRDGDAGVHRRGDRGADALPAYGAAGRPLRPGAETQRGPRHGRRARSTSGDGRSCVS